MSSRNQVEYSFGDFVTHYDPGVPVQLDLDDLLKIEAQYRAEAEETK